MENYHNPLVGEGESVSPMTKKSNTCLSCSFPSLMTVDKKLREILRQSGHLVVIKTLRKFNQLVKHVKKMRNIIYPSLYLFNCGYIILHTLFLLCRQAKIPKIPYFFSCVGRLKYSKYHFPPCVVRLKYSKYQYPHASVG